MTIIVEVGTTARQPGRFRRRGRSCWRCCATKASRCISAPRFSVCRAGPGQIVSLNCSTPSGDQTIEGSDILVATGRTPNTAGIGLDLAGVALDAADISRSTTGSRRARPTSRAVGECAGSPQFTHVSEDDFRIIRDNLAGGDRTTAQPARALLHVHRPAAGAGRLERSRGPASGHRRPRRETADRRGVADADNLGDARLYEGAGRGRRRPHSRFRHARRRGRRSHGRGRRPRCWRACPTRACATRSSRTRQWPRAWAGSSRTCRPDESHGALRPKRKLRLPETRENFGAPRKSPVRSTIRRCRSNS